MPISHKVNFKPYPTPEQQRNLQLHPRNYPQPDPTVSTTYSSPHQDGLLGANMELGRSPRLPSPVALGSRIDNDQNSSSGSYYTYDNARGRSGLDVPHQSPRSRINPDSPNLAGAFNDPPKFEIPPSPHRIDAESFPTLRVISWSPQIGEEGTTVTILLDPLVIHAAPATATSSAFFGPGSPALPESISPKSMQKSSPRANQSPVTRRFRIAFGSCVSPTKFSRIASPNNLSRWAGEDTALVSLSAMVPARRDMGGNGERAMVIVQILDENSRVLEDVIVGEWDAQGMPRSSISYFFDFSTDRICRRTESTKT